MSGALRAALRWLWMLVALAVIAYAALVALGRELLPRLDGLQPHVDSALSQRLGAEVTVRGIDGDWTGLAPRLRVASADFAAAPGAPHFLEIEGLDAELDLLRSLFDRQPAWSDLSVRRLRVRLSETESGWRLNGGSATAAGAVGRLVAALLSGQRTRIDRVELTLDFRSGEEAVLGARDLLLENSGSFHRAGGELSLAGREFATLAAEWRAADPVRDWRASRGRARLKFSRLDLSGSLGILLRGFAPAWSRRLAPVDTPLDAELWLTADGDGRAELRGRVTAERLALAGALSADPLRDLSAGVTGWIEPGKGWGVQLQELAFSWRDLQIDPLTLGFRQPLGTPGAPRFSIAADHLDLATLNALVLASEVLPERAADILGALAPEGRLEAPRVDFDLGTARKISGAQATLKEVAVASWRNSPILRGVSGTLRIAGRRGSLVLDGDDEVQMRFPTAYDHILQVGRVRGRVEAELAADHSRVTVTGSPLRVVASGDAGTIAAAFTLTQPLPPGGGGETPGGGGELWLSAGIRDTHADYARQYLPRVLEPKLGVWLQRALGAMSIPEAAFIWRGPVAREAGALRTVQVYARVADATIAFDPQWPKLDGVDAQVAVDDTNISGTAERATIAGVPIAGARFHTTSNGAGSPLLAVTARAQTEVERGLAVLARSPPGEQLAALRDWHTGGRVAVDLELAIPLSRDHDGASYRVSADLLDASLEHRGSGLRFDHIRGALQFSAAAGLRAENLRFRLWEQPFSASLRGDPQGAIEIVSTGEIALGALPGWPAWLRDRVTGATPYRAHYHMPSAGAPELEVTSDLVGLAAELPAPFAKTAPQSRPLRVALTFGGTQTRLAAELGQDLQARALLRGANPEAVAIAVGGSAPQLPAAGLDIRGHLESLDIDAWRSLLPAGGEVGSGLERWQPHVDLSLDHLKGAGLDLSAIRIEAGLAQDGWLLRVDSDTLAGTLSAPLAGRQPLQVDLDHLVLPKPDLDDPEGRLAALDPRDLPELDFATRGLRVGERELGEIAFSLRRLPDGVRAEQLRGDITGLRTGSGEQGAATLEWRRGEAGHRTRFEGTVVADDLAEVLGAWDLPGAIESERAELVAAWEWPGRPWEVRARNLSGETALHIRDGTFRRTTGSTSNALMKLIGLVNFDTWLRRLQLDFSDLFAEGMAFDELDTRMTFDRGTLHFSKPVKVELPSGKIRLEGSADLIAETIDAHLVATLPVGTNLPWIAALAGGLPAAAGVYLTSRIFERQVDRISSLAYRVTGPWEDPHIEVERIFSDKTQ